MTYQHPDFTLPTELLEQIAEQGFETLPELIRIVINEAMRMERQRYLGVAPYQRSAERRGRGNGFKDHSARTRMGEITFTIPQVREGGFFPQALEKGLRSERALTLSLAEMYVQGVSTRKVSAVLVVAVAEGKWATAALSQLPTCPQPSFPQYLNEPKGHQSNYRKKHAYRFKVIVLIPQVCGHFP
jgi:transposase-like protein